MKRMNLKVEGITCSGCAVDIESALKNVDGIVNAEASYVSGDIGIEYHPEEIGEKQVLDLVRNLGLKRIS
jgi:Cu+-exporting ATPase